MLIFLITTGLAAFLPVKLIIGGFIIFSIISIAYYIHLKNRTSYFAEKGIPTPPLSSLFLGHLPEYEKDKQSHLKLAEWEKKYGDTYGIYEGAHKVLVSSDINLINEVLIKQFHVFRSRKLHASSALDQENDGRQNLFLSEGNRWKRLRALISSCLTIKQIINVEPIMKDIMDEMINSIEEKRIESSEGIVDFKPEAMKMGFSIIRRIALGIKSDFNDVKDMEEFVEVFERVAASKSWRGGFFAGTYDFLFITKYLNIISLISAIGKFIKLGKQMKKLVKKREEETEEEKNSRPKDLVDFLMDSCIDENEIEDKQKDVLDVKVQKKLTKDELAGTCILFLIGGTDTTANTLTFLLYDLAMNKNIQEELIEEIDTFIQNDEDLTYHKMKELELLDRVIRESSRLHPISAGVTARRAREDTVITKSDGTKIKIDNGVCFMPNLVSVHMDEKIWGPNTDSFDPDRFLPENTINRPTLSWLTFGQGPRICPGVKLAMHELKLAVIKILKEYTLDVCKETSLEAYMGTLLTVKSMKLKITKRNQI